MKNTSKINLFLNYYLALNTNTNFYSNNEIKLGILSYHNFLLLDSLLK